MVLLLRLLLQQLGVCATLQPPAVQQQQLVLLLLLLLRMLLLLLLHAWRLTAVVCREEAWGGLKDLLSLQQPLERRFSLQLNEVPFVRIA